MKPLDDYCKKYNINEKQLEDGFDINKYDDFYEEDTWISVFKTIDQDFELKLEFDLDYRSYIGMATFKQCQEINANFYVYKHLVTITKDFTQDELENLTLDEFENIIKRLYMII